MSEYISKRVKLSVILIALAGQIAWMVENQYFNVFVYNEIAPVPIYVSFMVAASAIAATLTSISMGAFSDVKGKRRPFLIIGFVFWTITTAIFPFSALFQVVEIAIAMAIIFDCIMTFFGSTAYDAAFNAYITDITTLENRGKVSSIVEMMTLLSILITYGLSGFIIEAFGYYAYFFIVAILVGLFGITGAYITQESTSLKPLNVSVYEHVKSSFKKENIKKNKDCFLVLSAAALWGFGFNIFFPFIVIYLQHYIGLDLITSSIVIFIAFLIAMIGAYPIGMLTDKVGRKKIAFISVILASVFLIFFALMTELVLLVITGTLWVFFMTSWTISSNTWIKDLYPAEKYGQFSGYFILFTVLLTMIPGPLIGGWLSTEYGIPIVIDGVPGTIPTPIIFIVAALLILLTLIPLIFAKESKK